MGLHLDGRHKTDRIREESIEFLSRIFLHARSIEQRTSYLSPFQSEIAGLVQQWANDTPQVAVMGAFSSGKSTLLNRLIGKSLLPATRPPTTAVVTSIRYDNHAHGILHYRPFARLTLLSPDARSPDPAAIQAMRQWIHDPAHFGIQTICEVDEHGHTSEVNRKILLRELDALDDPVGTGLPVQSLQQSPGKIGFLKRVIGKQQKLPTGRYTRSFEVTFKNRQPKDIDLSSDEGIKYFGRHLTEPKLALSLQTATCCFPDPRLQSLNFLDTAGLCSPVGFHKDVTAELINRRPDKILVLLDIRRLDSPTNIEALKVLGRFISAPGDYRQVTFALTFWELALRTHMLEDSETELDYDSREERISVGRKFAAAKRKELVNLLSSSVGIPCESEPVVFTLGLGDTAPPEMKDSADEVWMHLEKDCSSWVGINMWAERWRAAEGCAERLIELYRETIENTEKEISHASETSGLDDETTRINAQVKIVSNAFMRAKSILRDVVATQRPAIPGQAHYLE